MLSAHLVELQQSALPLSEVRPAERRATVGGQPAVDVPTTVIRQPEAKRPGPVVVGWAVRLAVVALTLALFVQLTGLAGWVTRGRIFSWSVWTSGISVAALVLLVAYHFMDQWWRARRAAQTRKRPWPLVAAGLLGAALLVAGIIFIQTDKGQFVIETDDPYIAFRVTSAGVKLEDRKTQREYDLRVARHDPKTGEYELEITEAMAGLGFTGKSFTIKRGEKVALKASFKPATPQDNAGDSPVPAVDLATWGQFIDPRGECAITREPRRVVIQRGRGRIT